MRFLSCAGRDFVCPGAVTGSQIDSQVKHIDQTGFALGFIFLSPPFSPIRFFCAIFLNIEPDFGPFFVKKKSQVFGNFSQKSLLSLTPLILVDYSIYIDTITME